MAKKVTDRDLPTISIVTPSYDGALATLEKCLALVRTQNYPQKKIGIILGHGGEESKIKPIAKKHNARYILIPKDKQNAEYNRGVAFNKATGELVLILDHDNYMPTPHFLREYVQPFLDNKKIVAVESCYYHYDASFPILDRYFALFGVLDPVPYYLGKADRMNHTYKKWNLLGKAEDKGDYYIVQFEKDARKIPTIGTNGCMMRRTVVMENAQTDPDHHYPIDVMVDVIQNGHTMFAFTKNSLTHLTGSRGVKDFIKRRIMFVNQYHYEESQKRRYSVFMKGDLPNLLKFVFYSVTIVKPTYDAFRGFLVIPDVAWFLHPLICASTCVAYGYGTLQRLIQK